MVNDILDHRSSLSQFRHIGQSFPFSVFCQLVFADVLLHRLRLLIAVATYFHSYYTENN